MLRYSEYAHQSWGLQSSLGALQPHEHTHAAQASEYTVDPGRPNCFTVLCTNEAKNSLGASRRPGWIALK